MEGYSLDCMRMRSGSQTLTGLFEEGITQLPLAAAYTPAKFFISFSRFIRFDPQIYTSVLTMRIHDKALELTNALIVHHQRLRWRRLLNNR